MYIRNFKISSTDVAMNRKLRISALLRMAQDATVEHTTELGMGRDKTLDRGFLWVIIRQVTKIYRLPEYDESVRLETWPGNMMHVFFPRYTRLLSESGEVLAEISAFWTLINAETRQLISPESEGIIVPGETTGNEFPLPYEVIAKNIVTDETFEFTVPYSYADINGHMSNLRYLDIVEDVLPDSVRMRQPSKIICEYANEIRFAETVKISYGHDGNRWLFRGDGDKHKFSVLMEY